MKKFFFAALFLSFISLNSNAQFAFGAGLTFDVGDNLGIRGVGAYDFDEEWRGQAAFSYFFESDVSIWALDFDAHYKAVQIGNSDEFSINPFGGIQIANTSVEVPGIARVSNTEIGVNLGINILAPVTDELVLFIEPKVVISGLGGLLISAGVFF